MTTRDLFRNGLLQAFTSVVRKEQAQVLLETRMRLPSDNIAILAEEITRLFRTADPHMPEVK